MRTSRFIRLLALTFSMLIVFSGAALADPCALCGQESGTDSYLCTVCLLDLLEGEDRSGGLTIHEPILDEHGYLTVSWSDASGNGPYSVYYELLESAPVPFGWTAVENTMDTSCTLTQLVPGVSYIITVTDSADSRVQHVYYAQQPENGNEIGARIRFKTMRRLDRKSWQATWSGTEIALDNGYAHGLYLRLTYSTLKRTRHYAFCISVEAPNGFSDVVFSGTLELHHGKSQIPVWGFIPMDDYFAYLENYYGGVPAGEYIVTMYFDGGFVYSKTFNVVE